MYFFRVLTCRHRDHAARLALLLEENREGVWSSPGTTLVRAFLEQGSGSTRLILLLRAQETKGFGQGLSELPLEGVYRIEDIPVLEADYFPLRDAGHGAHQLRIYSLKDPGSAWKYMNVHWKRHLTSLPKFGVTVEGIFLEDTSADLTRVIAVVSYPESADIQKINKSYMRSFSIFRDMLGFNVTRMAGVEEVTMIAIPVRC